MNCKPQTLLFFVLTITLFACKKNSADVCETGNCSILMGSGSYVYPIVPGMPQWSALTSSDQKLAACQIPLDTLNKMTTENLIQSCLDFPLLGDLLLNVTVDVPGRVKYFMENFSGMNTLYKRNDAGTKMLARYQLMYPSCAQTYQTLLDKGNFTTSFTAFEMLVGYDSIILKMSVANCKTLVTEVLKKYACKKKLADEYSLYTTSSSLYLAAKAMISANYEPFKNEISRDSNLQLFVQKLLWVGDFDPMLDNIRNHAELFSKS